MKMGTGTDFRPARCPFIDIHRQFGKNHINWRKLWLTGKEHLQLAEHFSWRP
jgi:hypothetical protein